MSKSTKQDTISEGFKDPEIVRLIKVIMEGWPNEKRLLPDTLRKYWSFREEMSVYEGIVFRAHQILVPLSLRNKMLKAIHAGHTGIQGCTRRAKQTLFWIGMTVDIAKMVENCTACEKYQKSNEKHVLINNQIPSLPFEIVSSDLFHFEGNEYLLLTDSYSGYVDFVKLKEPTSKAVIGQLKQWFATHGIPRIIHTDNGPQYASHDFVNFSKDWSFDHITSSPYYPRSNGLAERAVQTAKNLLKRCTEDGTDIQLALLMLRNTPRDGELQSANQRLMSRILRSTVQASEATLRPKLINNVEETLKQRRQQQKEYADRGAVKAPEYTKNQKIVVQDIKSRTWKEGKIDERLWQPRSYTVRLADGSVVRRNARDLRLRKTNDDSGNHSESSPCLASPVVQHHQEETPPELQSTEGDPVMNEYEPTSAVVRTRSGREVRMNKDRNFEYY